MARHSKLIAALDAHKGRNYDLESQRKQEKRAKRKKGNEATDPGQDEHGQGEAEAAAEDELSSEEEFDSFGDNVSCTQEAVNWGGLMIASRLLSL